jgi:tetratricopeptide (TPR) repeat protein
MNRSTGNAARARVGALAALLAPLVLGACAGPATMRQAASSQAEAARQADRAAPAMDSDARIRQMQQAEALYLSGRLKEAQAAFEELTRLYPRNAEMWFKYGNTLLKLGRYDDAATALQNALSVDPGLGKAALNLALVRLAQAQGALDSAHANLAPDSAERQRVDAIRRQLQAALGQSAGDPAAPR